MLRSIKDLIGYSVKAIDGNAGKVIDCLFNEEDWKMIHLLLDTGHHLKLDFHNLSKMVEKSPSHRRVMVEPENLEAPETGRRNLHFPVNLTKETIMHNPGIEADPPKSLEYKDEFTWHYRHTPYSFYDYPTTWALDAATYVAPISYYNHTPEEIEAHQIRLQEIAENHTQSCREVLAYYIEGKDHGLGTVDDLIVDDTNWRIVAMAIRYGFWPRQKHRMFNISHVTSLNWNQTKVHVDFSSDELERIPIFDPHDPVNHSETTDEDFDYYGKPVSS